MLMLASTFGALDWSVLGLYALALLGTGIWLSRGEQKDTDDYFLGGRRMPAWAVAISVVATSMSAASFVGAPQQGYASDLTYLSTNIGMILAAVVIAVLFVPAFYRAGVQSIYALLETRLGAGSGMGASAMFLLGRIFASGARVFIGAIPLSLVLFGDDGLDPWAMSLSIGALTLVGVVYTLAGGVASVIWSDVIQFIILIGAALGAVWMIGAQISAPTGEVLAALRSGMEDGASKLTLLDTSTDPHAPFTLLAAVFGFTLMGIGSYGTDQDLAQRLLTCKNARGGARSIVGGILLGVPSVTLFLVLGLLLWLYYQRPELMGDHGHAPPDDSRKVFLVFIMEQMPAGLRGLMMAGLFAAGLSSLNSAINAMSSAMVSDFYRHFVPGREPRHYVRVGRIGVVAFGLLLGLFACACVLIYGEHAESGGTLLTFALTVMTFAYAGLIGVFGVALLTRRGNTLSVIAALVVGFVLIALMQPLVWGAVIDLDAQRTRAPDGPLLWVLDLAFVWKLTIASAVSFGVCALGARPVQPAPD
ncbi:MAG: sodium/solute symporter [Phycisphaerales bacterium JB059]